jgi:hypothetical protein
MPIVPLAASFSIGLNVLPLSVLILITGMLDVYHVPTNHVTAIVFSSTSII